MMDARDAILSLLAEGPLKESEIVAQMLRKHIEGQNYGFRWSPPGNYSPEWPATGNYYSPEVNTALAALAGLKLVELLYSLTADGRAVLDAKG